MQLRFEGSTALLNEVIDYLECFLFLIPLFLGPQQYWIQSSHCRIGDLRKNMEKMVYSFFSVSFHAYIFPTAFFEKKDFWWNLIIRLKE